MIFRVFGLAFGLKLMERGERVTQQVYSSLKKELPEVADVLMDEQKHEIEILDLIKENHIKYAVLLCWDLMMRLLNLPALWPDL